MSNVSPYEKCPVYETDSFIIRFIQVHDTKDLVACYADPGAARYFNADNCHHNFICNSLQEMKQYVEYWIAEYKRKGFVRWSVVDREKNKAIGTIEMFAWPKTHDIYQKIGVLRIDLASEYEKVKYIGEIVEIAVKHFYDGFIVDHIITKAIPAAGERISALRKNKFTELEGQPIVPYDYYFIR